MPTHPHAPRNMPAPLSDEPDALRVVFNAARRKAFYNLVCSITAYMRSQLELERRHEEEEEGGEGGGGNEGDQGSTPSPPPYTATDADGEGSSSGGNARPQPRRDGDGLSSPALVRLRRAALLHFDSWRAETLSKLKEVAAKPDDQRIVDARRKRAEELSSSSSSSSSSAKAREEEEKRRRRNGGGGGSSAGDLLVFDDADAPAEGTPTNSNSNSSSSTSGGGIGGSSSSSSTAELEAFQELYHPIPTRLTTVPLRDREEALSATLLLLLSGGRYSAHSRALACHLASALGVAPSTLDGEERAIATTMAATARKASASASASASGSGSSGSSGSGTMSADAEAQRRRDEGRAGRLWKVGLASVAGAALVGVTGGLAAPVVAAAVGGLMSSVGLGGLAGFLGLFWMNGALVGTLFGAFGAKMTGEIADRYAKEVEDFRFLPLDAEWGEDWKDDGDGDGQAEAEARRRRLRVTIGVNGWLESEDDVTRPWRALGDETEVFALRYEMGSLTALGGRLRALVGSAAWGAARAQVLRRTALATLQGALWPVLLLRSAAAGVDNPFALARHRSDKAGRVLADALAARVQGERPVTLVGYSLGARVVWACLRALADRRAFGLVDSVVLIGAPVPSSPAHWAAARSVVAGRLVNVHSANDYVLGLLHRGTSLQLGVAGLQAVSGVGGVEDLDLTDQVHGHLRYPGLIPQILHRCGFPNVKGGGAPIETEKEVAAEIELRDRDYAELGTLIDIGEEEEEETPPPPLPRRTVGDRLNDKFDPTVKNVLELKSDAQTRDAKLMGHGAAVSGLQKTSVATASSPSASDSLVGGGRERSASTSHSAAAGGQFQGHGAGGRDDDSDEYGEDQITMVDDDELSDGELTMVEPLSIDDDDPQTYTTV